MRFDFASDQNGDNVNTHGSNTVKTPKSILKKKQI